jgi:hypothetical protein
MERKVKRNRKRRRKTREMGQEYQSGKKKKKEGVEIECRLIWIGEIGRNVMMVMAMVMVTMMVKGRKMIRRMK